MKIKTAILLPVIAMTIGFFAPAITAQTISVLTTRLRRPNKTILTDQGNLLVAEAGTGIHDGRISIINPQTGLRRTLLNGLPSAVSRFNLPQGPSSMVMRGRDLFITIGEGNPTSLATPRVSRFRIPPEHRRRYLVPCWYCNSVFLRR